MRELDRVVLKWHNENASHNLLMVTECSSVCAEESLSQMFVTRGERGL